MHGDDDHIIMRQVLEVDVPTGTHQQYEKIQQTVERHFKTHALPLLNQILSQHTPEDVVIKLDDLKIELGSLALENVETTLAEKFTKKLTPTVQDNIARIMRAPDKEHVIPLPKAKSKAVWHYLSQGYFAWWMPTTTVKAIELAYLELAHEAPEAWEALWVRIVKKPKTMHRVVEHFTLATLKKSIQWFMPTYAEKTNCIRCCLSEVIVSVAILFSCSNTTILGKSLCSW